MRILRALPLLAVLGGSLLGATPAAAATSTLTLTLTQRWNAGSTGAWTPYVASVRNDGAADFTGEVVLHPVDGLRGMPVQAWPDYQAQVTVPRGSERAVTFYVVEPTNGYQAALVDASGRTVVSGVTVSGLVDGAYAVGVLSDQPQAGSAIEALKPLVAAGGYSGNAGLRASRFPSAQDFPTNAVFLSGLTAVVVDDFDVSTLSDAQVRALHDFVELGGSLVVAAGSAWRRTLLPLAEKGFPGLTPSRSGQASLQPLGDLAAQPAAVVAPIAIGDVSGARVLVGGPGQPPLAVEAALGAGRVIDLAFDPLADPIASDESGLPGLAWGLALGRAVLESSAAGSSGVSTPGIVKAGPAALAAPPASGVASADEIVSILQNTPAAAVPPIGLLGLLLVVYVLLAGPLNYFALRGLRRRELMWVTVPLVALVFTGSAYVVGAAVHGSNYVDNEVQLLRLTPDGAAEVHSYHGLYPPHRGNFTVDVAVNTLASTALGSVATPTSPETAVVDTGSRTQVELEDTAYSGYRGLQTLAVAHPPATPAIGLEAHLRIVQGRVQGTVRNAGDRPVDSIALVSGTGQEASIAADLQPHATATVDSPLSTAGQATAFGPGGVVVTGGSGEAFKRETLVRVATGAAATGRAGEWSLTGLTDPVGELIVEGARPIHTGLAALIQPVSLDGVDSLALAARASIVLAGTSVPYHYDVIDLVIPPGYTGPVKLGSEIAPAGINVQAPVRSIEVYDWDAGTWRSVAPTTTPGGQPVPAALTAGETRGAVRVRVSEQGDYALSTFSLVAA